MASIEFHRNVIFYDLISSIAKAKMAEESPDGPALSGAAVNHFLDAIEGQTSREAVFNAITDWLSEDELAQLAAIDAAAR